MSDADSLKNNPGLLESPPSPADPGLAPSGGIPQSGMSPSDALSASPAVESLSTAAAPSSVADADGWQTVDFPDAVRVDDIPWADGDIPVMAMTSYAGLVQQLQQENGRLRDRINHLEETVAFSQLEARSEIFYQGDTQDNPSPGNAPQGNAPQDNAPELTPPHPTVQRQQILLDTLNEQLQSCQDRIAQLEEECALAQQRFNDQVQQRLQAETTCRDLRTRLHRQQQQALQFKTALEKCLEMPAVPAPQMATPIVEADPTLSADATLAPFVSKTSPVQPWSQPADLGLGDPHQGGEALSQLANPKLAKLMGAELAVGEPETVSPALPPITALSQDKTTNQGLGQSTSQSTGAIAPLAEFVEINNLVNLIFPDSPPSEPMEIASPEESQAIFDISPFFARSPGNPTAAGSGPAAPVVAIANQDADLATATAANGGDAPSQDPLWDNLDRLIQPPTPTDSAPANPVQIERSAAETIPQVVRPSWGAKDSLSVSSAAPTEAETVSGKDVEPVRSLGAYEPEREAASVSPGPSQPLDWLSAELMSAEAALSFNLKQRFEASDAAGAEGTPEESRAVVPIGQSVNAQSTATLTDALTEPTQSAAEPIMFMAAGPSPILYPLRPTKKLKSLAAVELPTFPQR
jgi:hypothetical protein